MIDTIIDDVHVQGDPALVASYQEIVKEYTLAERAWIADLRQRGVKAAHPDDGWVDRTHSTLFLCYPQFNDGVGVGDIVALGTPGRTRYVKLTDSTHTAFGTVRYGYTELIETPARQYE
jgi:hypothetical protein